MWDRLLGGGDDEDQRRIQELETELAQREKQLEVARARQEKADERRRAAAAEKQEAQRRTNVLEERVRNLEAELGRVKEERQDSAGGGFSRVVSVPPRALATRLSSYRSPTDDLVTLVSDDLAGEDVVTDLEGDLSPVHRFEGPGVLYHDQAGALSIVADPPLLRADPSLTYADAFDAAPLDTEDLRRSHVLCFVRSDEAAVARVEEGELTEFRHLSADVMSRHTKGGFSQKRFERLREEQVKKHVEDAEEMLRRVLRGDDFVALGGDASVATRVASTLDMDGKRYAVKPLSVHDVEDEEDLARVEERFWSVQVYVL